MLQPMKSSEHKSIRAITITSGKGGVGKTVIAVNFAIALAQQGKSVLLLDADLGLSNIDITLGIPIKYNLSHVLKGECTLQETLVPGPFGIKIIPGAFGNRRMTMLNAHENSAIINAFSELADDFDVLVIDTASGISESVLCFACAAQDIIITVCNEPTSIADAYALIKLLNQEEGIFHFRILANMVHSEQEGRRIFEKITKATDRILNANCEYIGAIPFDEHIKKAICQHQTVMNLFPNAKSSQAFRDLAAQENQWPMPTSANGHIEFFVEKLLAPTQMQQ